MSRPSSSPNWPRTRPQTPDFGIEQVHFFPLGGIKTNATWVTENGGAAGVPANA